MYTDSQKIDAILEKAHSIDVRLSVLEASLRDIPGKVDKLESDSRTSKLIAKIAASSVPVLIVLIKWLGLSSLIQSIGEIK